MGSRRNILLASLVINVLFFGSLFEENIFSTIEAQVSSTLKITKLTTGGDDIFDFTVTGPTSYNPSISTTGGDSSATTILDTLEETPNDVIILNAEDHRWAGQILTTSEQQITSLTINNIDNSANAEGTIIAQIYSGVTLSNSIDDSTLLAISTNTLALDGVNSNNPNIDFTFTFDPPVTVDGSDIWVGVLIADWDSPVFIPVSTSDIGDGEALAHKWDTGFGWVTPTGWNSLEQAMDILMKIEIVAGSGVGIGIDGPSPVDAGTYSIQESIPAGWILTDATCNDGSSSFSVDTISDILIEPGDNIECTFENEFAVSTDTDGDGILDNVDTLPNTSSDDFSDISLGGTSSGTITTRGNQILTITEEPNPDGVRIDADISGGVTPATVSVCAGASTIDLSPGDEIVVTCGSVIVKTISGEVEVILIASDGTQASTSIPSGNEITFDPQTSTIIANPENTDTIVIMIGDTFIPISPGSSDFTDADPPQITINSLINDEDSFIFGNIPPEPTCTAQDDLSGVDGDCSVIGYQTSVGTHQIQFTASDIAGNTKTITIDYQILPWSITGFYPPVDMGDVLNRVKGGSTVPLKFEVFQGTTELTETSIAQLIQQNVQCDTSMVIDEIEITATGNTELSYNGGKFHFNWKTPKLPNTCWDIILETTDESSIVAHFKLK